MNSRSVIQGIFFGNYFYGICAVALSIEAALQQNYPLNNPFYYLLTFAISSWYYTRAYITDHTGITANKRTNWYIAHKPFVRNSQRILFCVALLIALSFVLLYHEQLMLITYPQLGGLLIFPFLAMLYYGFNSGLTGRFNLRNIGWAKPFLIGFIWSGMVTVYPILFSQITQQAGPGLTLIQVLLFIKNFMFIAILCIMFDIKDYAMDYNQQLKTFVVKKGLRKTIFYIIIPLCIAGLGSFLLYGSTHRFSLMKIVLNTIPFLLTLWIAYSLHKRKSILYYLIQIDGLMLVKALCGIIAMIFF